VNEEKKGSEWRTLEQRNAIYTFKGFRQRIWGLEKNPKKNQNKTKQIWGTSDDQSVMWGVCEICCRVEWRISHKMARENTIDKIQPGRLLSWLL
jgi:hypothetical protein